MHRDYQQIIGLGPLAIPLILTELEKSPGHWFWALTAIVGYTPVHQGHTGNIQQISEDWLEWGRQMGYLR